MTASRRVWERPALLDEVFDVWSGVKAPFPTGSSLIIFERYSRASARFLMGTATANIQIEVHVVQLIAGVRYSYLSGMKNSRLGNLDWLVALSRPKPSAA